MNNTIYTVYWLYKKTHPNSIQFINDLNHALAFIETLRKKAAEEQFSAITICAEDQTQVGLTGVDSVANGKLPSGEEYSYTKDDALSQRTAE
jgi:hypothetical protein